MSKPIFSRIFGQSPITPMKEHMAICEKCAESLIPYFDAVLAGDWDAAADRAEETQNLEQQADDLKKDIRLNLPRSLFLQVSREDLLKLLRAQDQIANSSRDIVGLILGRRMEFPKDIQERLREFLDSAITAVEEARESVEEFDDLMHTGFANEYATTLEKILDKLDTAEKRSDEIQVRIRSDLFKQEKNLYPVDVMFLYRIFDLIGDVADNAQTVGNRLTMLIAR